MFRKLPLALAVAWAVSTPFQAHALGLGDINTKSFLNQNFDAEIQLMSVPVGEIDGVRVTLASSEAFARAGVDRPFLLSKLRFKPVRKDNGDAVIAVTSIQPIREPFLNFLVEVNWPEGRVLREYTVLLDPPMTTGRMAPAVKAAASPAPVARSSAPAPAPSAAVPPSAMAGGEYRVQRKDTLWTISNRLRPNGVSVQQMMLALLDANPKAFVNGNINRLKAGAILRVPDREEVVSRTEAEAIAEARSHYRDWRQPDAGTGAKPATATGSAASGAAPAKAESEADAQLKLTTARPEGDEASMASEGGLEAKTRELEQQLLLAQESIETSRQESDEMRDRMQSLEEDLQRLQRLLTLKDEQLAQLQSGQTAGEEVVPVEGETPAAEVPEAESVEPVGEAPEAEPAGTEPTAEAPAVEPEPTPAEPEASVPAAEPAPEPVDSQPVPKAPQLLTDEDEPAPKPKGLVDSLGGGGVLIGIAIAVLVILVALIMTFANRGKRKGEGEEQDQDDGLLMDSVDAAALDADLTAAASGTGQPAGEEEEDTSFLSEFAESDMAVPSRDVTSDVDPLSEADIYIAYGRYEQAEELVKQGLEREPDRLALKHKLLEIYYANQDVEHFNELANAINDSGEAKADGDAWNRAMLLGQELDPDNPLYSDAIDVPSVDVTEDLDAALNELESQLTEDVDSPVGGHSDVSGDSLEELDLSELAKELSEPGAEEAVEEEKLDADSLSLEIDSALEQLQEPPPAPELGDFEEQGEPESILEPEAEIPQEEPQQEEESVETLSLDIGDTTTEEDTYTEPSTLEALNSGAAQEDEGPLTIEDVSAELDSLGGLDELESDLLAASAETETLSEAPLSLDDISAELAESEGTDDTVPEAAFESDSFDAVDDVDTKLDLAKAYVEMGDKEGARAILQEVMEEGSDKQKQEAESLVAGLDG